MSAQPPARKVSLRMEIGGELARKLHRLKETRGAEAYTEVIRDLINEAFAEMRKEAIPA